MTMLKTHYQIRFDRVGRGSRGVSQEFWADDAQDLSEQIFKFVRPKLISREFTVVVDLDKMEGSIEAGRFGMFKIERV